jgi:DNA invertase Pin-like site-specific DNA recombinase
MSSDESSSPAERFSAALLAATEQFERDRRAEIIAAGGDPDGDHDPLEYVRWIADSYASTADDPAGRAAFLASLAPTLDLEDARAIRQAAEAVADITPRLIQDYAQHGVRPADIAVDLGVTESYVYRKLREQQKAEAAEDVTGEAPPVDEHRLSTRHKDK